MTAGVTRFFADAQNDGGGSEILRHSLLSLHSFSARKGVQHNKK